MRRLQPRVEPDLAPRDRGGAWAASYALANFYRDGDEAVGAHSGTCTYSLLAVVEGSESSKPFSASRRGALLYSCITLHVALGELSHSWVEFILHYSIRVYQEPSL